MLASNGVECLTRRTGPLMGHIIQALTNRFFCIGACSDIEKSLVSFGVLNNSRRPAVDGEHQGALALFELFHQVAGTATKRRQRVNVFSDIQ